MARTKTVGESMRVLVVGPGWDASFAQRLRCGSDIEVSLASTRDAVSDEAANFMPDLIDCVKSEATLQEICDVPRGVFGEGEPVKL